jgi:arylsulfatase A-like enzyme
VPSLLERRHVFRRSIAAGVLMGTLAAGLLAALEAAWVLSTAAASFDGAREIARFVACTTLVLLGAGALVGALEGALAAVVSLAANALGDRRSSAQRWKVRLYTALLTLPVAVICAQIFAGPRARTIAGHHLYAIAIGVLTLAAFARAVPLWQRLRAGLSDGTLPSALGWLAALAALALTVAAYVVDQRVLVRLYPFFHRGLGAIAFAAAQLTVALAFATARAGAPRRAARWLQPRLALSIGCLALSCGAWAWTSITHQRALRTISLERTAIEAPLLRLWPRAAAVPSERDAHTPESAAQAAPLPSGPQLGPVDLILVTVDAMRADRLAPRTAPFLSQLGERAVLFDRAYAQVPHTSFSMATLLTGKYVFALSTLGLDAASHETLAEVLRRERYKTAAFYPPSVFFIDHDRLAALEKSNYGFEYVKYEYLDAHRRTDQVIHFLEEEHPEHAFIWVHYLEPHEPYEDHPGHLPGARTALERYDGEVHFVDAEIARLSAYLRKTRPHALLVVTADHGEEFGEHGGHYHGTTLYEEQVHVPLMFVPLNGTQLPPHRVSMPVGVIDLAPTLLGLVGIIPSARMQGRDLGPWLLPASQMPAASRGPVFAEIERKKMVIEGTHKLICDLESDACAVYDLSSDPGERKNRIGDEALAAPLKAALDRWMSEETRFESQKAADNSDGDAETRHVLERARHGDRTVVRKLAAVLATVPPPTQTEQTTRLEAARLICGLPADPATRDSLAAARGAAVGPLADWLDVALARVGDEEARRRVRTRLEQSCGASAGGVATGDGFCARAPLAIGDVAWLGRGLELAGEDMTLQIELISALGRSHDPRALDPLIIALGNVRTRMDVVQALSELDDPRVLGLLARWVAAEPYISVRARMVTLMAQLERRQPNPRARAALVALANVEREAQVMAALLPALGALGAANVVDLTRGRATALAGGELWVAGSGEGTVEVKAGGAVAHAPFLGVALVRTVHGGPAIVQLAGGDGTLRWALSRSTP